MLPPPLSVRSMINCVRLFSAAALNPRFSAYEFSSTSDMDEMTIVMTIAGACETPTERTAKVAT